MVHLPVVHSQPELARSVRRADVTDAQWFDWRWQLGHMLTTADELATVVTLSPTERAGLAASAQLFRTGVTPYYASLMDPVHASCPIRLQSIPHPAEADIRDEELRDPLGEDTHNPAPSVVHKYPDRVLFLVVDRCGIYCRHCNRRRLVGGDEPPTTAELEAGLEYIAKTPRIRDVLLSGGDPLLLSTRRLGHLLSRLRAIPHVETIRIGTRLPVVCPMRIDDELCAVLEKYGPIWLNTQFNHPREVTPEARQACDRLLRAGVPVNNQTVLLKGVNDHAEIIRKLNTELLRGKVRPYYLFQCDMVRGLDHFRTRLSKGIQIMEALRGLTSGLAIPSYVVDVPGGGGKIPLMPNYILSMGEDRTVLRNYEGIIVSYEEARDDGRPSARVDSALPPPRNDVYRLLTGEVRALIPAGNERMARRKRRCESGSPST